MKIDLLLELIEIVFDTDEDLSIDMAFIDIPNWDSVNAMRLFSSLEEETGKKLSMKAYLDLKTIRELLSLIDKD